MIDESELKVGECYFLVAYCDPRLSIPKIKTLLFLGKKDDPDMGVIWSFGSPMATDVGGNIEVDPNDVLNAPHELLNSIVDWAGLILELTENKKAQDRGQVFQGL